VQAWLMKIAIGFILSQLQTVDWNAIGAQITELFKQLAEQAIKKPIVGMNVKRNVGLERANVLDDWKSYTIEIK
jgi:hypothetical protein